MATTTQDEIDITAVDPRPGPTAIRAAIHDAIRRCATLYGEVHIAQVRARLPLWATGPQVGATICALTRSGHLVGTGRYAPNGNTTTRNRTRPAEIRRLVRPLPKEGL